MNHHGSLVSWHTLLLMVCLVPGAPAQKNRQQACSGPEERPRRITSLAGITEYRLNNGLDLLLFPDPSRPTVTVNIVYLVGSRNEGYGETGMAHLLEHLMFKGTPGHPDIWKALQDRGAQFNGTTALDRTNYYETLPAGSDNLGFALELEADRMIHSFIARKDLDSEMTVVRNEFEIGENDPLNVLAERIMSTAYLWHNYGHSTIGARSDIEQVSIDRLRAFYKNYYQPDNAVLIVAGKFEEDRALDQIQEIYGHIQKPDRVLHRTYTIEPVQDGEREVTLRRIGNIQALGVVYHICPGAHQDLAALSVLSHVLTAQQTGRLYKALVETGLATRVMASAQRRREPGVLRVLVESRVETPLNRVRAKLLGTLDRLREETFTPEEVERAKTSLARSFKLAMTDSTRIALQLTEWASTGDWRLMFVNRDRIARITPADVERVAATYLKPSNRTLGQFIPTPRPDRVEVPPAPDPAALPDASYSEDQVPRGKPFETTYAHIDAVTEIVQLPVGLRLAVVRKESRGGHVVCQLTLHYGSEEDLTGKTEAASLLGSMLLRGTTHSSSREIRDRLAGLGATLDIGDGTQAAPGSAPNPGMLLATIECSRENLAELLALLAEVLREPSFPPDEFKKLREQALARMEQQTADPMALALVEIQCRLNPQQPGDVRYLAPPEQRIENLRQVALNDIEQIYRDLLGASAAEMVIVGDIDSRWAASLLQDLLGDWTSPKPFRRIARVYRPVEPAAVTIKTPDKANSVFALGLPLEMRDDDADYPALYLANIIFGGGINSRLMDRLRQREGLSYSCGSGFGADARDEMGSFMAFGMCAPENIQRAIDCTVEEMDRLAGEKISQQQLDDARKAYSQQMEIMLANDTVLAALVGANLHLGRRMAWSRELTDRMAALTPEDLRTVWRNYLDPADLVVVRAGDFPDSKESSR